MTKREPFAKVVENTAGNSYLVAGEWICGEGRGEMETLGLEEGADQINAAHDKAVREAVEEFRERAAKVCADHYFDSLEGQGHGEALASMIRALPTEPEA